MANTVDIGLMGNQHIYKYWLHRISHEWDVSYKLLSMGYLTIGWSAYSNSGIERKVTCSNDTDVFESMMKSFGEQGSRSRWNLWYFCNFRKNDYVVVPLFNGEFSIFRLKSRAMPIGGIPVLPDNFVSESGQASTKAKMVCCIELRPKRSLIWDLLSRLSQSRNTCPDMSMRITS